MKIETKDASDKILDTLTKTLLLSMEHKGTEVTTTIELEGTTVALKHTIKILTEDNE